METRDRHYRPGERVPGTEYVVVRLEAEGGHGALYLVRHHFLEKKLQMLKTLRSFEPSQDLVERLKREAQMLAAMDHPHIVSVTSGGLTDEKTPRPYFVMERLKGRSLAEIVPEAPRGVGVDAALKVTIEVCDALEYVHTRHGIVHRDIKPDNVFLQVTPRNGSITKLLDFGVSHIMDLEKRYTKHNVFLGTPRYAAPEQIMGDKPTPQTDLYSVGLMLYELLVGRGPFDDKQSFGDFLDAHLKTPAPGFPTDRRFPDGLEEVVLTLLRKKPTARPKSAEALASQLRQIKREAEQVERAQAHDLNRTEATPVQNILTGRRGELTEGPPPEVASSPAVTAVSGPMTVRDGGPESAPESAPDTSKPTLAVPMIGFQATLATPGNTPDAAAHAAATRSLNLAIAPDPERKSDTQPLSGASEWLPKPEPEAGVPPSAAPAQGLSVTSAPAEVTRPSSRALHGWKLYVGGAAVAGAIGVCFVGLTRTRPTTAVRAAAAPSPDPVPADPPAPANANATATATATATPTPTPTPTATPLDTPVPAPSTSAAPAPRPPRATPHRNRLPASGL